MYSPDVMKYLSLQEVAYHDKMLSTPSSYGFVLAPNGNLYHLTRQYYHGVVIALLEPETAIGAGIGLPEREYVNVYDYQDFMFAVSDDLGYITVGIGIFNRISYDHNQKITKEQVDSLKKYFYNTDLLHDKFTTNQGDCSGAEAIRNLEAQYAHFKMNGGLTNEAGTTKLIEPEFDELGNLK